MLIQWNVVQKKRHCELDIYTHIYKDKSLDLNEIVMSSNTLPLEFDTNHKVFVPIYYIAYSFQKIK